MKKGEARKQLIIETAEKLFYEKGYENTSVQDVLDALGFSKGGFYHHFESKLSLLEAICDIRTEEAYENCVEALKACEGGPVEKLNVILKAGSLFSQGSVDFIGLLVRVAYRDGCVMLRDNIKRTSMQRMLPLMDEIIREGFSQKIFYTAHLDTIGRLILLLGANLTDEIADVFASAENESESLPKILDLLDAYRNSIELLLNAPHGSVQILTMEQLLGVSENLAVQKRRQSWAAFQS